MSLGESGSGGWGGGFPVAIMEKGEGVGRVGGLGAKEPASQRASFVETTLWRSTL